MNDPQVRSQLTPPAPGLDLGEVLYVLFRHKWKIAVLCVLAVLAAMAAYFTIPRVYESEARLYIRYVLESRTPTQQGDNDSRIHAPDRTGHSIINNELQILTSMDLAQQVADALGPEKLLGPGAASLPDARVRAGTLILKNLKAEVPRDSSVVRLAFQHTKPELTQPVVTQLIQFYFKKHAQIHAVGAFDEFLSSETDQRRAKVAQTEDELRKAKSKLGIISLPESRQAISAEITRLEQQVAETEAQLAERRSVANELMKTVPALAAQTTNSAAGTNYFEPVPPEKLNQYRQLCGVLDALNRHEQELLLTYTPSSKLVSELRQQIATNEVTKKALETAHPGLLVSGVGVTNAAAGAPVVDSRAALNAELAAVSGLEARLRVSREQLAQWQKKAVDLTIAEGTILDLERQLQLQETNYSRFAQSLEQAQIEERLGAGKVSNISTIQEPTPPLKVPGKRLKIIAMVFFGGLALAFGLPFVIELYLDPSVRRASDVQTRLRLPLFISVPVLSSNGHSRRLADKPRRLLGAPPTAHRPPPTERGSELPAGGASESSAVSLQPSAFPGSSLPALSAFSDALRDRLITWFEIKQMTHKPKLVAVTSCGEGAGVTTLAAGLAASLSETGEGNVLLVDMNGEHGAAHQFHRGDLACGIDDALQNATREGALVQDNLYVVSETANSENLPSVLPKKFKGLVPKLKASDYDYIIFDMPPVSQVSLTPRLSRFMDLVLMVVESERTDREVVSKASSLLTESQANVGVVLNKTRTYVPKALKQEL